MARNVQVRELLVGIEGLALLRHLYDGTDADAERRLAEVRAILGDEALAVAEDMSEADVEVGYRSWSEVYDEPGNPLIDVEQPVVWALLDSLPPGPALDAACGTGRHARRLVALGHEVTGIDTTPEMLERARIAVPDATFVEADVRTIPAEDAQYRSIVCGLALAHVDDLSAAVDDIARVLTPGGRLIVSVLHPFQALLGWHAPFVDDSGQRHFVREHPHTHADYLAAFAAAGLVLRGCVEPALTEVEVRAKRRACQHAPDAALAAYVGLPAVLVWDVEKL